MKYGAPSYTHKSVSEADLAAYVAAALAPAPYEQNVILDGQWLGDADQLCGLRMYLWAHKIGAINLVAITCCATDTGVTNGNQTAPQVISQFMATQGVSGIPVAIGPTTTSVTGISTTAIGAMLSQSFTPSRRILNAATLATSVPIMRQVLANAAAKSVLICSNGNLNNLSDLLNSAADSISPLTGAQLIAQSVSMLYTMGGQYPLSTSAVGAEYNFGNVAGFTTTLWACTNNVLQNWPSPITFIGYETGPANSVGAYYSLTTTDPLGYSFDNSATYQFGRQGWTSVSALIALLGANKAGFSVVQGKNSINVTTGFNTFQPGMGNQYYVVQQASQRAIQQLVDAVCAPGATQPTSYTGVSETIFTTPALVGQTTDANNLICWWSAADLNLSNGASITSWGDRCGRANLVQATTALQPTYATAQDGKIAAVFSGTNALVTDANVDLPHNCTVYALVECSALSTAFMFALTHGISVGSSDLRGLTLGRSRTSDTPPSSGYGQSVIQTTFSTGSGGTLTVNAWAVITLVRNGGAVQCFVNGVGGTVTTISTPANFVGLVTAVSNHIVGPLVMGAAYVDGTPTAQNGWNGGIREIRVYNNAHSAATVATIAAGMT